VRETDIDAMAEAYAVCAVWVGLDWSDEDESDNPRPLDENYSADDITPESRQSMWDDCHDFFTGNEDDLAEMDPEQAGHDFFLTRNRHGAGFWDRGLGELGDRLTKAAHVYGESDLYVADDGRLYVNV
jgi:hypothetical protein